MKPTELVRKLKRELTLSIWGEGLAAKNGHLRSKRFEATRRVNAAARLLGLAAHWNDKTVPQPLCEQGGA